MKLGPLVLFEHEVSDEVYVPVFREAFSKLESTLSILKRHGLVEVIPHIDDLRTRYLEGDRQVQEEYNSYYLRCAEVLADHIMIAQTAHNRLVDLWPRKALRGAHRELTWTMKAYLYAVADMVEYEAILGGRGSLEKLHHHQFHGRQWDDLAAKREMKLFGHLRKLQADEPETVGDMVGVDLPDASDTLEYERDSILGTFTTFLSRGPWS
jgi:hypothetical protein